jgi:hypothetical protein
MKNFIRICILALHSSLILSYCNTGGSNSNGITNNSDTVFLRLSENISSQEVMFNYVKTGEWKPVFVEQIDNEDQYGYTKWQNFSIITDFTKEEFDEMKKYASISSYLENCPNARNKYTSQKFGW